MEEHEDGRRPGQPQQGRRGCDRAWSRKRTERWTGRRAAKAYRLSTTSQPRARALLSQRWAGTDQGEAGASAMLPSIQTPRLKSSSPVGKEAKVLASVPKVARKIRMRPPNPVSYIRRRNRRRPGQLDVGLALRPITGGEAKMTSKPALRFDTSAARIARRAGNIAGGANSHFRLGMQARSAGVRTRRGAHISSMSMATGSSTNYCGMGAMVLGHSPGRRAAGGEGPGRQGHPVRWQSPIEAEAARCSASGSPSRNGCAFGSTSGRRSVMRRCADARQDRTTDNHQVRRPLSLAGSTISCGRRLRR